MRWALPTLPRGRTAIARHPMRERIGFCRPHPGSRAWPAHSTKIMATFEGDFSPPDGRFAIVVARFNALVTEPLLAGCRDAFVRHGVADDRLDVAWVPGSFEIPLVARTLAESRPLRGGGLPRLRHPRRDRPLRPRGRPGRRGGASGGPGDGRARDLRHPDDRDGRAGAQPRGAEGGEQGGRGRALGDRDGQPARADPRPVDRAAPRREQEPFDVGRRRGRCRDGMHRIEGAIAR